MCLQRYRGTGRLWFERRRCRLSQLQTHGSLVCPWRRLSSPSPWSWSHWKPEAEVSISVLIHKFCSLGVWELEGLTNCDLDNSSLWFRHFTSAFKLKSCSSNLLINLHFGKNHFGDVTFHCPKCRLVSAKLTKPFGKHYQI